MCLHVFTMTHPIPILAPHNRGLNLVAKLKCHLSVNTLNTSLPFTIAGG